MYFFAVCNLEANLLEPTYYYTILCSFHHQLPLFKTCISRGHSFIERILFFNMRIIGILWVTLVLSPSIRNSNACEEMNSDPKLCSLKILWLLRGSIEASLYLFELPGVSFYGIDWLSIVGLECSIISLLSLSSKNLASLHSKITLDCKSKKLEALEFWAYPTKKLLIPQGPNLVLLRSGILS